MQEKASQADQTTQKNTPKAKLSKYHTQLAIKKKKQKQSGPLEHGYKAKAVSLKLGRGKQNAE